MVLAGLDAWIQEIFSHTAGTSGVVMLECEMSRRGTLGTASGSVMECSRTLRR